MKFETIRIEGKGQIRQIVLNRPNIHNAINKQLVSDMLAACAALDEITEVRVVLICGEGKSFCSGADLKERPFDEPASSILNRSKNGMRMADAIASLNAITIACLHNYCIGGGAILPAFCDFRIASLNTSLTINEVSIGVNLSWNAIPAVVQLVGSARAKEMIILGRKYSARRLLEIGFVNEVVEDDQLIMRAEQLAREICRQPPMPVWSTKASINAYARALDRSIQHLDHLSMAFMGNSPNMKIARESYFANMPPKYIDE